MTDRQSMCWLHLVVCLCSVPLTAVSAKSLCESVEHTLFTCSIGKKAVSVCASKDLSHTSGYMQYRFGRSKQALELVYPAQQVHPAALFSYDETGYAKSSLENLFFVRAQFTYTIYRESAAFDANGAGIIVKSADGKSVRLSCKEENPASGLYLLHDLGLRVLPEESLASLEEPAALSAESPNVDLLQGALTHDAALMTKALASGADPNFQGPRDSGVISALVDGRSEASSQDRLQGFDAEIDRLITLLVSHGASLTKPLQNGATQVEVLWNSAPYATVRGILDAGWPEDFQYRLYAGALLGDPTLVKDSLDRGANPNVLVRGNRILAAAILKSSVSSEAGVIKDDLASSLSATEELLRAGAAIEGVSAGSGGGDIASVFSNYGAEKNIRPLLDLLVKYSNPVDRKNAVTWLSILPKFNQQPTGSNLEWLLSRLQQ